MPNILSEDEIRTGFRMLNIPYAGPLVLVDNLALNTTTFAAYNSTTSAQTRLRAWLVGGAGQMDDDSITKAQGYIQEYANLRAARSIELNGGVGGVTGVTYSVPQQIEFLIADLRNLVPFYQELRDMMAGAGSGTLRNSCAVLC